MCAEILLPTESNIELAARELLRGELVAMPTETVYGLAGLAFDETALTKIFATKERPTFDPLICHVAAPSEPQPDWLEYLRKCELVDVSKLEPTAEAEVRLLLAKFWPGPITLVLPKQPRVPDLSTSGLPTVAVRSPAHPIAQALLSAVGQPLAAPSANRFGRISPTRSSHVQAELGDRIAWILEGGDCEIGLESTVLFVQPRGGMTLLRPGGVSVEEIGRRTGIEVNANLNMLSPEQQPAIAPGLLASHYAPCKPLRLLATSLGEMPESDRDILFASLPADTRLGLLLASGDPQWSLPQWESELKSKCSGGSLVTLSLSAQGDASEAARQLFAALRALDECADVEILWAEPFSDNTGLGFAINDRLRRASHR